MAKEEPTKKPVEPKLPPELESADGPIPWENWDNDQRFSGKEDADHYNQLFGPGTGYDKLVPKK